MLGRIVLTGIVACSVALPSWAEEGSAEKGVAYAVAMCSSCHAVTADQAASPNAAAKPFRSIKLADSSGAGLTGWFNTAHPNTGRILKDSQGDDIAALIKSLTSASMRDWRRMLPCACLAR